MVFTATSLEWTMVGSELEALQLEYTWIKEFTPRFNIMFRDDKSYPYLAVTMGEKFPRAQVMRGERKKDTRYFGPFYPAKAIRETLDTLLRVFPVRTCSAGVFNRAQRTGRPCLLGYIGKCSAPCVGSISEEDHRELAAQLCTFMSGEAKPFIVRLEKEMARAVDELDYETAARVRDDIAALKRVFERNTVVLSEDTEADVFAIEEDELEAAVQVFHVRGGRIRGQRGWVVEKVEETSTPELVEHLLQQVYGEGDISNNSIPREVLVPVLPSNAEQLSPWLRGLRGARVDLRVPQRGDKAVLMQTVAQNAADSLRLHKSKRAGDLTTRSVALQELQTALNLPVPLMRIECFDISHVQGTNVVASMVVVEDGLPRKADYRKFSITGDAARDDTASMYDVITRRFRNYSRDKDAGAEMRTPEGSSAGSLDEQEEVRADTTTPAARRKFSYPPNLVVVDGGQPQVAAASRALVDLGVHDVFVIGLAKRLEEVWVPDSEFPIILPRASQGLFMLQRIRDEAHRFAITFHRAKRGKSMTESALDAVPGLGPSRQRALLKYFGSVRKLRAATIEELQKVPGVGPALATEILSRLGTAPDESAAVDINTATGEVSDSWLG
ncbi:excinuclease ABC subunit UvrC [Arthrobacter roseus]